MDHSTVATRAEEPARPAESFLSVQRLTRCFGDTRAVDGLSLDIARGELVSFVGPSGCGKTTLLRVIAGFLDQDEGSIVLDGEVIDGLPPEKRPTGMVFQAYALFPHMTVMQNVAYGLDVRGVDATERDRRVAEALEMVQLTGMDRRKPRELSGGQQQRVALARCLVLRPKALLLDEPLSNLDANLRVVMRDEIRRLKDELDLTVVFVTHDQEEALSISDRLLVLAEGRLQQLGTPREIYRQPANAFVARFMGDANLLTGRLVSDAGAGDGDARCLEAPGVRFPVDLASPVAAAPATQLQVMIRPEAIAVDRDGPVRGEVLKRTYHGRYLRYQVACGETTLTVDDGAVDEERSPGDSIGLHLPRRPHVVPTSAGAS